MGLHFYIYVNYTMFHSERQFYYSPELLTIELLIIELLIIELLIIKLLPFELLSVEYLTYGHVWIMFHPCLNYFAQIASNSD